MSAPCSKARFADRFDNSRFASGSKGSPPICTRPMATVSLTWRSPTHLLRPIQLHAACSSQRGTGRPHSRCGPLCLQKRRARPRQGHGPRRLLRTPTERRSSNPRSNPCVEDVDRVLGLGMYVIDVSLSRLHVDVVHVCVFSSHPGPDHQTSVFGDHWHHRRGLIAMKDPNAQSPSPLLSRDGAGPRHPHRRANNL